MFFFNVKNIEPREPAKGVEMRIIHGNNMTMVFFSLAPGVGVPAHSHSHEQMGTVLNGSIELVIGPEKKVVTAGEAYHIPSDVLHEGRCLDGPAQVLEVFAPRRDELTAD